MIEHEVPEHGLVHLLELRKEDLEIVEVQVDESSPCVGKRVSDLKVPDGATVIAVMREGKAEGPRTRGSSHRATRCWPCCGAARRRISGSSSSSPSSRDVVGSRRYPSPSMFPRRPFLREIVALSVVLAVLGFFAYELASGPSASARPQVAQLRLQQVASGLDSPLHVAAPRNERGRVYIVLQDGKIVVLENGRIRPQPFLDIDSQVMSGGEQGLLSVAFHPRYATNRLFYVNYTDNNGDTRVVGTARTVEGGRRVRQLLFVDQPYPTTTAASSLSAPTGVCTSAWATAAPAAIRRTVRRTPRAGSASCSRST